MLIETVMVEDIGLIKYKVMEFMLKEFELIGFCFNGQAYIMIFLKRNL